MILRTASAPVEIAHCGVDGVLHGHSLIVEATTRDAICLDEWRAQLAECLAGIEGQIERTIGARTFEDVALVVMQRMPAACRVVVRLPTRGHSVEATRDE